MQKLVKNGISLKISILIYLPQRSFVRNLAGYRGTRGVQKVSIFGQNALKSVKLD